MMKLLKCSPRCLLRRMWGSIRTKSILDDHHDPQIGCLGRCDDSEKKGLSCDLRRKTTGSCTNCEDSHIPCILSQETWVCSGCDWRFPGKPAYANKKNDHMKRCKGKCRRCKEENLPCRSRTMGTTAYLCCIFCRDAEAPCSWDDTGAEEED